MGFQERSLDDMPLAAYTTGVVPHREGQDALAPQTAGHEPRAVGLEPAAPAASTDIAVPAGAGAPTTRGRRLELPDWLTRRPESWRDPRLLPAGMIVVGAILLGISLLGGGGGPAGQSAADPTAAPVVPVSLPPGEASVEITGTLAGTFGLSGVTGIGPAIEGQIESSWSDALGNVLTLAGPASSGTRTTDGSLRLGWTTTVGGATVSFVSDAGECTVGMAVKPTTVTGTFFCKKVRSDDGKYVVDAQGAYRT